MTSPLNHMFPFGLLFNTFIMIVIKVGMLDYSWLAIGHL
jgi:hypothetical protein